MSKQIKKMLSDDLKKSLGGVSDVVVLSIEGVDGIQNNQMRLALRKKNIQVQVVKNSLAKRLFGELGLEPVNQFLEGPSAVAWGGQTIVDLAKEISDWAGKIKKLKIKGGTTTGLPLSADQVTALSKLPSREELLARVMSLALSPAARLVNLMTAPAARIAAQLKTKYESAADAAAAPDAAASDAAPAAAP